MLSPAARGVVHAATSRAGSLTSEPSCGRQRRRRLRSNGFAERSRGEGTAFGGVLRQSTNKTTKVTISWKCSVYPIHCFLQTLSLNIACMILIQRAAGVDIRCEMNSSASCQHCSVEQSSHDQGAVVLNHPGQNSVELRAFAF